MKSMSEIKSTPRIVVLREAKEEGWAEVELQSSKDAHPATVVFSWGGGWDHVAVSFHSRKPTWDEMCEVKRMFFKPEETAWEYHPMESKYINNHPYALHIWRLQGINLPIPPAWRMENEEGKSCKDSIKAEHEAFREIERLADGAKL